MEEYRDLSLEKWNFRSILKEHLETLLHRQKIYWKQRSTIKWVKFADAITKFFHVRATINHSVNHVMSLQDENGQMVYDHDKKATMLWVAYKERLGTTEYSEMLFDLSSLLALDDDLDWLQAPFTVEGIDKVVKALPHNKVPGPNGFNTNFIKKCWPTISSDFYELCAAFFDGEICLQSINGSYVTLVPKNDASSLVGDFRPISLLSSSIKLITKLLANRLQQVILRLVHKNQYGFIKIRTIQDFLAWSCEYLHLSHKSKKQLIILKLDFEKAFDKIEHQTILDTLRHKGMGERWLK